MPDGVEKQDTAKNTAVWFVVILSVPLIIIGLFAVAGYLARP